MEPEKTYQYLKDLAEKVGISIRYEDFSDSEVHATSGLCKVRGHHLYIMDNSISLTQKINLLTECLRRMDLEDIYVLPAVRSLLGISQGDNEQENRIED